VTRLSVLLELCSLEPTPNGSIAPVTGLLVHDALIYSSDEEFVALLAPFLHEAVAVGEPAIAVTTPAKIALLRDALGTAADSVSYLDANEFYRRPARSLTAYGALLDDLVRRDPERVRIVGEVQFGATDAERANWIEYEAVLNRALSGRKVWIVCPYDTRALPKSIVVDAYRTHPFVWTDSQRASNAAYLEMEDDVHDRRTTELNGTELLRVTVADDSSATAALRSVAGAARAGGLVNEVVDDLALAVDDLLRRALEAGGEATVRILRDGARWICDVGGPGVDAALGVWAARLVAKNVDVVSGSAPSVQLTFESGVGDVRRRIVDAASELFYQDGIRATGIAAIIANAGVAKASFYHHFSSKDDLVIAWLQQRSRERLDRLAKAEQEARSPEEKLLATFDLLGDWFAEEGFRGFSALNAVVELPENENVIRAFQEVILAAREHFVGIAAEAGFTAPTELVEELQVLALGAVAMASGQGLPDVAETARRAAVSLLASAPRVERT
jgi:AcrR family transcriptional regulator